MPWIVLTVMSVTSAELQAAMLQAMQAAGLPTTSWTKQGFFQNLVNWVAILLRIAYGLVLEVARGGFLSTATDQALTDLAEGTYGTPRREATFATGFVTLWNQSGLPLNEVAEAISFAKIADPQITYKNSAPVSALNGQIVFVPIVCDVVGTVGNAGAGVSPSNTIELITVLTGVSLTENAAIVGQDAQSDESLRDLASKQAAVASTGHGNKYEFYAFNTNTDGTIAAPDDGKTRTNINRAKVSFEDTAGRVFVVLASPSGAVDPTEYTTTVNVLLQYALTNPGILFDFNATPVELNIDLTVELEAGASTDGVEGEVSNYVTNWFGSTANKISGSNGFITLDELKLLAGRANVNIRKVTIDLINGVAAADVALNETEVATLGVLNVTVAVEA